MPFAAAIQAGTSILGGVLGQNAAKKAANAQRGANLQAANTIQGATTGGLTNIGPAIGINQGYLNTAATVGQGLSASSVKNANDLLAGTSSLYNPYTTAGAASLPSLQQLSGPSGQLAQQFSFDPSNLANDPAYQFIQQQGQQAIDRSAAAEGNLFSSGTAKSLANYATGTASQYENQIYNQALNTFNTNRQGALSQAGILQNLSGMGLSANSGVGNLSLAQASNLVGGGQYQGNLGFQAAGQGAQLGMQGTEFGANFGLQGATAQAPYISAMGGNTAAGTIGANNAIMGGLGGVANAATGYLLTPGLFGSSAQPSSPSPYTIAPMNTLGMSSPYYYPTAPGAMPGTPAGGFSMPDYSLSYSGGM